MSTKLKELQKRLVGHSSVAPSELVTYLSVELHVRKDSNRKPTHCYAISISSWQRIVNAQSRSLQGCGAPCLMETAEAGFRGPFLPSLA